MRSAEATVKEKTDTRSAKFRIIDAYLDLSFKIGVANITLDKLAAESGLAFSTVRYYFNGESRAIHDAAMERVMERSYTHVERLFERERRSKDFNPIQTYAIAMYEWVRKDKVAGSFLIYFYYLASSSVETEYSIEAIIEKARGRVESLLLEAIGKGLYDRVNSPRDCATMIHATVVGHGFIAMTLKTKDNFDRHTALCLREIDLIIEGAALRPPGK